MHLSTLRLSLVLAAAFAAGPSDAATLTLRLLETSDIHMNLLAWDYYQDKPTDEYGLAKTITLIRAARGEARNSLLFDNGDLLQGNPLGDVVARIKPLREGDVHPAYKVLNKLGVDAANIGNHEFNYGLPFLRQAIRGAAFPYVNANVMLDDGTPKPAKNAFTPYVILDRTFTDEAGKTHALKVGVIGFVPPQILLWDRQHLLGKVKVQGIVESARRFVPEMRAKGAQLVVAIPHSGFERGDDGAAEGAENAVAGLAKVPGIDAILFGHAHAEFPSAAFADRPGADIVRGRIHGVPAVMPGRWGDHLGIIDLTLDDASGAWKVTDSRAQLRPIYDRAARKPLVAADPMVAETIATEHADTLAYVRGTVSQTTAPIHSYFAQVADDPSVQLVSQAQLAYMRRALQGTSYEALPLLSAAAPFKSGGRQGWANYTDIPAGPIAIKHVADLYVYPNTIKAVLVRGADVREWLEMSAGQFRRIDPAGPAAQDLIDDAFRSYNFDTLDGVSYRIDVTQPARYSADGKLLNPDARRIVDLRHDGKPIDMQGRFIVVTNNYRASGGGNFPGLDGRNIVVDAPDENREAVAAYLAAQKRFNPSADNNWRIQPVPGVALRFTSGAGAVPLLTRDPAAYPGIRLVKDNGDGSALFELPAGPAGLPMTR